MRKAGKTRSAKPRRAVPLQLQLLLAGIGLTLVAATGAWTWLAEQPEPESPTSDRSIPPYDFTYNRLLTEQEVKVTATPRPRAATASLYLWTTSSWKKGRKLDAVKATLALSGVEFELYPGRKKNRFHFRLGPFASVSDRNNARQELSKENLKVQLTAPPTG